VRLGFYEAEVVSKKLVVKLITEFLSYTFWFIESDEEIV
jgi:hypothetical protein